MILIILLGIDGNGRGDDSFVWSFAVETAF